MARAVRRNLARAGLARKNHHSRTRPRPRPVRAGCSRLVRKEVSRLLPRRALRSRRSFAGAASAHGGNAGTAALSVVATLIAPDGVWVAQRSAQRTTALPGWSFSPRYLPSSSPTNSSTPSPSKSSARKAPSTSTRAKSRFVETWTPSSPDELEFLDRHSIHPQPGERQSGAFPSAAQHYMRPHRALALDRRPTSSSSIDYGHTRAEQLAESPSATRSRPCASIPSSANPYVSRPANRTSPPTSTSPRSPRPPSQRGMHELKRLSSRQSQFLMGIGEANQFADAFEDCRLPQERAKVALQLKHLVTPAGMGESFQVLVASKGIQEEKVSALAGT